MKIIIDKDKCIGCGSCVQMNSEIFRLGDDLKSEVIGDYSGIESEELVKMASVCPVGAIQIIDDNSDVIYPKE